MVNFFVAVVVVVVTGGNPYSRLMALQRMGIVDNYERIRDFSVAVIVCICYLSPLTLPFAVSSIENLMKNCYAYIFFQVKLNTIHDSFTILSLEMLFWLVIFHMTAGNWRRRLCCSWDVNKLWHKSSFIVWLWQSGVG